MNSKVIRDEPCPECRKMGRDTTGNHLMVYADGGKYCNRCGHYEHPNNNNNKRESMDNKWTIGKVQELNALDLDSRGLKASTLEKYGVKVAVKETTGEPDIVFFPRYSNGQLTGYKGKMLDGSGYFAVGNTRNSELFGQNVFPSGGKMVVVTEGEMDALAAHQIFLSKGKNYKVVSLPDGANPSALIKVQSIHEYLESYENVVLSFDMDKPGRTATEAAVKLLSPGKARVMEYTEKDANDMLLQGKISDYFTSLSNARPVKPQSIVSSGDTWERINNRKEVSSLPYPEDWSVLNKKTYGLRLGELDTWTSGSGYFNSPLAW